MASRLSEQSLVETYDQGHKSFYVKGLSSDAGPMESPLEAVRNNLLTSSLDLNALVDSDDPQGAVEAVAPQDLYHAMMLQGPEDCLAVLPYLSQEQWVKILDYDVWHQDELSPEKMMRCIELYAEVGPEELTRRYQSLDEEYQTAFLAPYLELVELEEYEKLPDLEQDRFHALPCGQLFYAFKTDHPKLVATFELLIQNMLAGDLNYLYSLLSHSFQLPPGEQEQVLRQMRRARLEEDGFLTFEESHQYFVPLSLNEQKEHLPRLVGPVDPAVGATTFGEAEHAGLEKLLTSDKPSNFLEKVINSLHQDEKHQLRHQLLVLANALCSATHVEPDDIKGAERVLGHGQATISLALEWLSETARRESSVPEAADKGTSGPGTSGAAHGGPDPRWAATFLLAKGPKLVFRTGLSLVHQYVLVVLDCLEALGFEGAEKVGRYYRGRKFGLAISHVETHWPGLLGLERTEWLKGLLNRFPLRLVPRKGGDLGSGRTMGAGADRAGATVHDEPRTGLGFSEGQRPGTAHEKTSEDGMFLGGLLVYETVASLQDLRGLIRDVEAFTENLHHGMRLDHGLGQGQPVGRHRLNLDDHETGL